VLTVLGAVLTNDNSVVDGVLECGLDRRRRRKKGDLPGRAFYCCRLVAAHECHLCRRKKISVDWFTSDLPDDDDDDDDDAMTVSQTMPTAAAASLSVY
jgi:hypothetical protein